MSKHTTHDPRADDTDAKAVARQKEEAAAEEQAAREQEAQKQAEEANKTEAQTKTAKNEKAGTPNQEQTEPQKRTAEPFPGVTLETTSQPGEFKVANGDEPLKDSEGKELTFKERSEAQRIAQQLQVSRPNDKIKVTPEEEQK